MVEFLSVVDVLVEIEFHFQQVIGHYRGDGQRAAILVFLIQRFGPLVDFRTTVGGVVLHVVEVSVTEYQCHICHREALHKDGILFAIAFRKTAERREAGHDACSLGIFRDGVHLVDEVITPTVGNNLKGFDSLTAIRQGHFLLEHVAHEVRLADLTLAISGDGGIVLGCSGNFTQFAPFLYQLKETLLIDVGTMSLHPTQAFIDIFNLSERI